MEKILKQERIPWIDRMRGLAILSVVIQHLSYNYVNVGEFVFLKLIGISNMAVFFFISGYIWDQTARINNLKEGTSYFLKKTVQIFLPFVVWTFLVYPYFFQTDWEIWNIAQIKNEFEEPHLWFLLTLYGYSFYFVAFKLINIKSRWAGILFWGGILLVLGIVWYKYKFFKMETLYMPYFAFGVLLSQTNLVNRLFLNKLVPTLAFFSIFILTMFWVSGATSLTNVVIKLIVSFSVISLVYLITNQFTWNKYVNDFIVNCGKQSLAIYVIHWSFLALLHEKLEIIHNELLAFIPVLLFAVLISYVCMFLRNCIKFSPFLSTLLFGDFKKK